MLYYLPGCDVNKNHPEAERKLRAYMKARGAAIAQCCQWDVDYLQAGDVLVQNCTQCDIILRERCPEVELVSLYEKVLEDPRFPWADFGGERMTIQDCFRTRGNAALQDAVRTCLAKMNVRVVEMSCNRAETRFCGVWLSNPAAEAAAAVAPETFAALEQYREVVSAEEQRTMMEAWVAQYETEKVVVYCNGCEKGLKLGGGNPIHIVELLAAGL